MVSYPYPEDVNVAGNTHKEWTNLFHKRLNSAPSSMDFGVIPDGVTDNTSALQSAIDDAISRGYRYLFIPRMANPYILQSGLTIASDFTLESNGATLKAVGIDKDAPATFFHMLSFAGSANVTLSGVIFAGENSAADITYTNLGLAAIRSSSSGSGRLMVRHCGFTNLYGFTVQPLNNVGYIDVSYCWFKACNSGLNWAGTASQVVGCFFDSTDILEIAGTNVLIANNIIRNAVALSGIVVGGTTGAGNIIRRAVVTGNIIDGVSDGAGIEVGDGLQDVILVGNVIDAAQNYGIRISGVSNPTEQVYRVMIADNIIGNVGDTTPTGIEVTTEVNTLICRGNYSVVNGTGSLGLRCNAPSGVIEHNYFRGDTADIKLLSGANVRLNNNDAPNLNVDVGGAFLSYTLLYSPDGTLWKVVVANDGAVSAVSA